jgi:hypothetical protein
VGVYGDQLAAFPELMKDYEVFKLKPRIGSGYAERCGKRIVTGYWSWRKQKRADIIEGSRTEDLQATFWVQNDFFTGKSLIELFDCVEIYGKIFSVVDEADFSHEGSFTRCGMQLMTGNTDEQVTNTKVDEVIKNDYE